jgi:hypothetical protein
MGQKLTRFWCFCENQPLKGCGGQQGLIVRKNVCLTEWGSNKITNCFFGGIQEKLRILKHQVPDDGLWAF